MAESMPGVRIDVVELDEKTIHPLEALLEQLPPEGTGPVMIVGLEKAVSSAEPDHPVLFNLNLSRPEWPRKVARPVVFWIPEYVLRFLASRASDFLDWRSDTLLFPEPTELDIQQFDTGLWMGEPNGWMSEEQRRARVEELRARLVNRAETTDPTTIVEYSSWLHEMGLHLMSLGELEQAEATFQESVALLSAHAPKDVLAAAHLPLIQVQKRRGLLTEAEDNAQNALELAKQADNSFLENMITMMLAYLRAARGRLEDSTMTSSRLPELIDGLMNLTDQTDLNDTARAYRLLGLAALEKGDLESGERNLYKALETSRQLGNLLAIAQIHHELGMLYILRGDFRRAEQVLHEALQSQEATGDAEGRARTYESLGKTYLEMGRPEEARRVWAEALQLYSEMDWLAKARKLQDRLDSLTEAESVPPELQPRSGEGIEPGTSVPGNAHLTPEKP